MSLENFLLAEIVREAAPDAIDQTIGRIFEPSALDFALLLRRNDNLCLFASLLPARAAIYLTNRSFKSLESERPPGHFTNLMRKYLTGATITNFTKEPDERRIRIEFASFDASGSSLRLNLLIELMGRSANAHLFVEAAYLASLRELPDNSSAISLSTTTATERVDARALDEESLLTLLANAPLPEVARQFAGFSPLLVRELTARAATRAPFTALQSLLADIDKKSHSSQYYPRIYAPCPLYGIKSDVRAKGSQPVNRSDSEAAQLPLGSIDTRTNLLLCYFELEIAAGLIEQRYDSLNQAAEYYFELLARIEAFQTRRNGIAAKLKSEIGKLTQLLKKLREEAAEFAHADEYRRMGDLILANLVTLHRTREEIILVDIYQPEQPEITLKIDEKQSPQQLAEDYFRRYQRARRGAQLIAKRIADVEKELAARQLRFDAVKAAVTVAALAQLESPATPTREKPPGVKPGNKQTGKAASGGVSLRHYLSTDGYEILVGRSDASNDQLTFRIAKPSDIWLHAADYPGSHVLIRNPERKVVPHKTIFEAAQLAAFFSKARGETSAAVRYTEKKHVTRPKKAKPGLAMLTQFKTIAVPPLEAGQRLL